MWTYKKSQYAYTENSQMKFFLKKMIIKRNNWQGPRSSQNIKVVHCNKRGHSLGWDKFEKKYEVKQKGFS